MLGALLGNTTHTTGSSACLKAMASNKKFPCNTCNLVFDNSQDQRSHMREPWHVYNLKLRMASEPPISAEIYAENFATKLVSSKQKSSTPRPSSEVAVPLSEQEAVEESNEPGYSVKEEGQANCCLFCTKSSIDLQSNVEHMHSEHGLYIPEIEHLSSLETIITYLRTVIVDYNECLYCGMFKQSAEGVRRHMLDKGHCMINLEREPELLEFWELTDSDESASEAELEPDSYAQQTDKAPSSKVLDGEYTLPSGRVVGSKTKARSVRLSARRVALADKEISNQVLSEASPAEFDTKASTSLSSPLPKPRDRTKDRTVAVRHESGLIGVSDQQRRSLLVVERKMQRQQAIVHASASWADELGGRNQKHYKQKMNLRAG